MSNEQLVIEIQGGRNDLLMELWEQTKKLAYKMAQKYAGFVETQDAEQEAFLALVEAVNRWDPEGGASFANYFVYWIEAFLEEYAAKNSNLKRSLFTRTMKFKRDLEALQKEIGHEPTNGEICDRLGLSEAELKTLQDGVRKNTAASIDEPFTETEDGDAVTLGDMLEGGDDPAESVIDSEYQKQLKTVLWSTVDELETEQSIVLHERYEQGKQLKEIAGDIGKASPANVSDVEKRAFRKLKEPKNRRKLEPFLYDDIYGAGLKGNGVGSFSRTWTSSTERTALKLADPPEKKPREK